MPMPRRSKYAPGMMQPSGDLEALATLASGVVAEPIAGWGGLLAASMANDSQKGAQAIENIRNALTYVPRTEQGVQSLMGIAETIEPIANVLDKANQYLGDTAYEATGGSPLAGAAGHTAIDAITSLPFFAAGRLAKSYPGVPSNFRQSGMLAGPEAVGADLAALEKAKQLKESGQPMRSISESTGWSEHYPGEWTYEIPDIDVSLDPGVSPRGMGRYKMSDVLRAPELYQAYPHLRDIPVKTGGASVDRSSAAHIIDKDTGQTKGIEFYNTLPDERMLSVALHELQHAVQHAGGRVAGTSEAAARKLQDRAAEYYDYKIEKARGNPLWKETRDKVAGELLGDRQVNFIPYSERAKLRRKSIEAADEAAGIGLLERARMDIVSQSPEAIYLHDMGEAQARMIQRRRQAVEDMQAAGMSNDDIRAKLKTMPFEYSDVIPTRIRDVEGEIKDYSNRLKEMLGI